MPSYKLLDNCVVARTAAASTGWTAFTGLQGLFDYARSQGRPLFFLPGLYDAGPTTILASNGGGKPLHVQAAPGTVTLRFTGGSTFMRIENQNRVQFENVTFEGQNLPLSDYVFDRKAFVAVGGNAKDVVFMGCNFLNSPGIGTYACQSAEVEFRSCYYGNHSTGIWSENAKIYVSGCRVHSMANNGISIWRDTVTGDSSTITGNSIIGIESVAGGTGQNGNGISVFRAVGVTMTDNKIFNTKYSAIRCNGGGSFNICGNNIYNTREVAIFIEAPGPGIDLVGGVVGNNHIAVCGCGILVVNSGISSDGVARSIVVEGNRISDISDNPIPDPGYFPPSTIGNGIAVEQDCVVSGNLIDGAARVGIQAGTNSACRDLVITGNLVRNAPIGVGVSNNAVTEANRNVVVSGNIVRGANIGGVVPTVFTGTTINRQGTSEYGNTLATTVGSTTFGHNRYS